MIRKIQIYFSMPTSYVAAMAIISLHSPLFNQMINGKSVICFFDSSSSSSLPHFIVIASLSCFVCLGVCFSFLHRRFPISFTLLTLFSTKRTMQTQKSISSNVKISTSWCLIVGAVVLCFGWTVWSSLSVRFWVMWKVKFVHSVKYFAHE